MIPEIKICGLTRESDVQLSAQLGARYLGFILAESSPRRITPARLRELTQNLPPSVQSVAVFANSTIDEILSTIGTSTIHIIQLHGTESESFARDLATRTTAQIWKAVHLRNTGDITRALHFPAHRLLVDTPKTTGTSTSSTRAAGADKSYSLLTTRYSLLDDGPAVASASALSAQRPIALAGGISTENIADAIRIVRPAIIDISSSVESAPGIKSPEKLAQLFNQLKK